MCMEILEFYLSVCSSLVNFYTVLLAESCLELFIYFFFAWLNLIVFDNAFSINWSSTFQERVSSNLYWILSGCIASNDWCRVFTPVMILKFQKLQ